MSQYRPNTIASIQSELIAEGDGCLVWPRCRVDGYGHVSYQSRVWPVHRLLFFHLVGPIPAGMQIDHLCRNRACANVGHLEVVSQQENIQRGERSQKTHCIWGHPLSGGDVYLNKKGHRTCKRCQFRRQRKYEQRKRQEQMASAARGAV